MLTRARRSKQKTIHQRAKDVKQKLFMHPNTCESYKAIVQNRQ